MTGRGKEEGPGSNYYIAEQQRGGPSRHTGGIQDWGVSSTCDQMWGN